jgi:hypothetical protein
LASDKGSASASGNENANREQRDWQLEDSPEVFPRKTNPKSASTVSANSRDFNGLAED